MARKRKSGEGTVRLRKDGRWEGRVVTGYDDRGYPKTRSVTAKTKTECLEKLSRLKEECGTRTPDRVSPDMPFGSWIQYWYENHCRDRLRPTTRQTYENGIRLHIQPELGALPLNRLTQNDLQQFYAQLKRSGRACLTELYGEGLSDRMVRLCHALCRSALEKAVQDGLLFANPAIGCKLPPKRAREMQVLSREEMQRFLIQAKAEGCYELFLLDLCTGLRRGELLALQWDDLNFDTGVLNVDKQIYEVKGHLMQSAPKTRASIRKLVLPPNVVAVLREYKAGMEKESRWMFPSPIKEDAPLMPGVVRKRLQIILERAGCKSVRFHDLRHTFATLALENGMDIKTLSAMLGHVSAATTLDVYTHVTGDMQRAAAQNIDRGIGGGGRNGLHGEGPAADESANMLEDTKQEQPVEAFKPFEGRRRRGGTGCISQISPNCWEGRYSPVWPDGKKHSRSIYAKTREECEQQLPALIAEMKAEIKAIRESGSLQAIPEGGSKKKRQIAAYMRQYPEVTTKNKIAREVGVDVATVRKYYEEIRREMG